MATRRAKIICTLGPSSSSHEVLSRLISDGMDVVRLNFSHGSHTQHQDWIHRIRKISAELDKPVAILQDLEGPRIRIGTVVGGAVQLRPGGRMTLTTEPVQGNPGEVSITYKGLPGLVVPGDPILLNDGTVELQVEKTAKTAVYCKVLTGGIISSHKGVNLPTRSLTIPAFTQKDQKDLDFGIKAGVDCLALSFVKEAQDVSQVKEVLGRRRYDVPVIAKIERHEALRNLDDILAVSDGVMVARGDLGIEIAVEKVPLAQKEIIRKANRAGKPVITATQMLRSMVESPRPTRAEVADVANAVMDGTDSVMLSEETAIGRFPVETVAAMSRIIAATESGLPRESCSRSGIPEEMKGQDLPEAACAAAAEAARAVNAKGIIIFTQSGNTARLISKYRPRAPILAFTPGEAVMRRMALLWGVLPIRMELVEETDKLIVEMELLLREKGWAASGDHFVILFGFPIHRKGPTNMIKLHTVE